MNEFEILTISQAQFQQNATYTIAIFILLAINFYLVRRSRELNFPTYGKVMVSFFSLISVYGGIQVATFLRGFQHNTAYNLKKLKDLCWLFAWIKFNADDSRENSERAMKSFKLFAKNLDFTISL